MVQQEAKTVHADSRLGGRLGHRLLKQGILGKKPGALARIVAEFPRQDVASAGIPDINRPAEVIGISFMFPLIDDLRGQLRILIGVPKDKGYERA